MSSCWLSWRHFNSSRYCISVEQWRPVDALVTQQRHRQERQLRDERHRVPEPPQRKRKRQTGARKSMTSGQPPVREAALTLKVSIVVILQTSWRINDEKKTLKVIYLLKDLKKWLVGLCLLVISIVVWVLKKPKTTKTADTIDIRNSFVIEIKN